MVVFAPFYRVFPSAETLLIGQAVLFALGVVPIARWAVRRLGTGAAVVVATGYCLSWGLQAAVNYDFHEIALAVPLLAFSVTALGERRWTAAMLWALPLVFVKEDLGLTVAVIGGLVAYWTAGTTRTRGVLTAVWGVGWTVLAVKVLIPWFSASGQYGQASKLPSGGMTSAVDSAWNGVVGGDSRASTVLLLLLITGFAALRSPSTIIALPTLAWRFISDNSNFWGPIYHYSAILMPVLFAALVDALVRGKRDGGISQRGRRTILGVVLVVAIASVPSLPLFRLVHAQTWQPDRQLAAVQALADRIPDGDSVGASNNLVPRLADDHSVSIFPRRDADHTTPNWIMVNVERPPNWPLDSAGDKQAVADALRNGYTAVADRDGIELLHRGG
ncbi:DUF2079 domain-containing protein [Antrihabitans cavernicola]|uniref:DUF2079 domain-containing protein n=1 Tax=Antrihabitans cavernicola TaxID=2495913 RepID=A0A5A7SCA7_9NOCA|nr:DUF2079 domain-containing protein [Spelaeibacter cavernicola]KAA0023780.1 DUF2079 domain-containing protein [Spelaeibacter cavernicola]